MNLSQARDLTQKICFKELKMHSNTQMFNKQIKYKSSFRKICCYIAIFFLQQICSPKVS